MTELPKNLLFGAAFLTAAMLFGVTAWATFRVGDYNTGIFTATIGIIMGLAGIKEVRSFLEAHQ